MSLIDKRIIEYLECGGTLETPQGALLIQRLIVEAMKTSAIAETIAKHNVDIISLVMAYAYTIRTLLPDPLINAGGKLLVPTLFFMEADKLDLLLDTSWDINKGDTEEEQRARLFTMAGVLGQGIYAQHQQAYGSTKGLIFYPDASQEKADQMLQAAKASGCLPILTCFSLAIFVSAAVLL